MADFTAQITTAARMLRQARHAVALTGAGVSTPSGIPDFRSGNSSLWAQHNPQEVASLLGFMRDPAPFFGWIRPVARIIQNARPNPAHTALAELESHGVLKALITQNVDLLHSRAGSANPLELHGHFRTLTCTYCFARYQADDYLPDFVRSGEIPRCPTCGHVLKPDVVLYGEQLPARTVIDAWHATRRSDLFLVAGSSLEVLPAADMPRMAHARGARLIIINLAPSYCDPLADLVIRADVADALPAIAEALKHLSQS